MPQKHETPAGRPGLAAICLAASRSHSSNANALREQFLITQCRMTPTVARAISEAVFGEDRCHG